MSNTNTNAKAPCQQPARRRNRTGLEISLKRILPAIAVAWLLLGAAGVGTGGCVDDLCAVLHPGYLFKSNPNFQHRYADAGGTSFPPCYGYHPTCWRQWPECCVGCPPPPVAVFAVSPTAAQTLPPPEVTPTPAGAPVVPQPPATPLPGTNPAFPPPPAPPQIPPRPAVTPTPQGAPAATQPPVTSLPGSEPATPAQPPRHRKCAGRLDAVVANSETRSQSTGGRPWHRSDAAGTTPLGPVPACSVVRTVDTDCQTTRGRPWHCPNASGTTSLGPNTRLRPCPRFRHPVSDNPRKILALRRCLRNNPAWPNTRLRRRCNGSLLRIAHDPLLFLTRGLRLR